MEDGLVGMLDAVYQQAGDDKEVAEWQKYRQKAEEDEQERKPLLLPRSIGYTMIRMAGKGSHSRVYKARVNITGEIIAVKIPFAPGMQDRRRDRVHRSIIKHEAAVLSAVRKGPHIITAGSLRHLYEAEASPELPMDWYDHDLAFLLEISKKDRGLIGKFILHAVHNY